MPSYTCPHCKTSDTYALEEDGQLTCTRCGKTWDVTNVKPPAYPKSYSDVAMRNKVERQVFPPIREALLNEREKTHGPFKLNAKVSQDIKAAIGWGDTKGMKPEHKEALDMIALKISRICSGSANFKDHWADIAGYAKLGEEACD